MGKCKLNDAPEFKHPHFVVLEQHDQYRAETHLKETLKFLQLQKHNVNFIIQSNFKTCQNPIEDILWPKIQIIGF